MAKIETGIFYYKVAGRDCQRRKISENKALEMEIILN